MNTFQQFVSWASGPTSAARMLGISRQQVYRLMSGENGITPDMASRVEIASNGLYRRESLVWPVDHAIRGGGHVE